MTNYLEYVEQIANMTAEQYIRKAVNEVLDQNKYAVVSIEQHKKYTDHYDVNVSVSVESHLSTNYTLAGWLGLTVQSFDIFPANEIRKNPKAEITLIGDRHKQVHLLHINIDMENFS